MSPQPYGSAAKAYLAAGYWPLPLPPRKKASPPEGYTGRDGREVTPTDVGGWILANRAGNIGLRLPHGVAGIDVDAWKDDQHAAAWDELTARCGPLPDAPCCTSRDDDASGIRLFRVPPGWEAAGKLPEGANGVSPGEVIQWHHRYVVCPPSIHPDTERAYRWRTGKITRVADLPALPQPWLDALDVTAAPPRAEPRHPPAHLNGDAPGDRPGDEFNARADWMADILGPHGWELHHEHGGTLYVTRPGKSRRDGHSATIGHSDDGVERLYVFSADAAPFEMEVPYTKFAAWALLNHGGDFQAAARELARDRDGPLPPRPRPAPAPAAPDGEAPWPGPEEAGEAEPGSGGDDLRRRLLAGGCLLDEPDTPAVMWGDDDHVLWAEGEALIICGPDGTGKTTLAGCLTRARLGIGDPEILGMAVTPGKRNVLYLAMDRPRQVRRALRRLFGPADRDALDARLRIWQGPPPADLARYPLLLAQLAELADADTIIVDSLKDAALKLSEDETGSGWNRARQHAIQAGAEIVELHHPRKAQADNRKPAKLEDLYGSRWITSGAGSVISLWGESGDLVVELSHLKSPAAQAGPWRMGIDPASGEVFLAEKIVDLVEQARLRGAHGMTAEIAARLLSGAAQPTRSQVEKARYQLDQKVRAGVLFRRDGTRGAGQTATWFLTTRDTPPGYANQTNQTNRKPAGQGNQEKIRLSANKSDFPASGDVSAGQEIRHPDPANKSENDPASLINPVFPQVSKSEKKSDSNQTPSRDQGGNHPPPYRGGGSPSTGGPDGQGWPEGTVGGDVNP